MLNNFPLLSANKRPALGNYASVPGTGPKDAVCAGCTKLQPQGSRFVCAKFTELTRRQGKPINTGTAACRYFSKRPSFAEAHLPAAE
jgi:hypothetical protein